MTTTNNNIAETKNHASVYFEDGILGFEKYKEYVIMQEDNDSFIMILQAVENEQTSLVVMDPFVIVEDYSPVLSEQDKNYFGENSDLKYLVVAVLYSDVKKTVVNLKSPIVIDVNTNRAKQVFVENEDYPLRYNLFAQ